MSMRCTLVHGGVCATFSSHYLFSVPGRFGACAPFVQGRSCGLARCLAACVLLPSCLGFRVLAPSLARRFFVLEP